MKRLMSTLAGAAIAAAAFAPVAQAQDMMMNRAVRFGVQGGLSMPMGDFGDAFDTGYTIAGTLDWRTPRVPVGMRFDVGYSSYSASGASSFDVHMIHGTAAAVITVPTTSTIRPYLLGGVGIYNSGCDGCDGSTDFGLHAGGGLNFNLGTLDTYAEIRYHSVFTEGSNTNFLPIVFGIKF